MDPLQVLCVVTEIKMTRAIPTKTASLTEGNTSLAVTYMAACVQIRSEGAFSLPDGDIKEVNLLERIIRSDLMVLWTKRL